MRVRVACFDSATPGRYKVKFYAGNGGKRIAEMFVVQEFWPVLKAQLETAHNTDTVFIVDDLRGARV